MDDEPTPIAVEFAATADELWALAQLVKRIAWVDVRGCAVSEEETRTMLLALSKLRRGLAREGFAPR